MTSARSREFAALGPIEISKIAEPIGHESTRLFLNVLCHAKR